MLRKYCIVINLSLLHVSRQVNSRHVHLFAIKISAKRREVPAQTHFQGTGFLASTHAKLRLKQSYENTPI